MKELYSLSVKDALESVDSSIDGLSENEAKARLGKYGPNKLKESEKPSIFQRFIEQLKDPMLIILMIAAAVYAVTGIVS